MTSPTFLRFVMASVLVALSSCGSQSFDVIQSQQDSGAPGATSIAPKVDILLAVDNSGSTLGIQSTLNASIKKFLTDLNNQGWDFRVTAVPLIGTPRITQISAAKFDGNWGAAWVPPYPGAQQSSTIPASMFVRPENYAVQVNSNTTDGQEPGIDTIGTALASSEAQNYFLRKEAILAVVVLSNGEDSSDPVDYSAYPYTLPSSVSAAKLNKIRNAKGSALAGSVHLFPVVSYGASNCFGERARDAIRYRSAGMALGGHSAIDICRTPMASVLAQLQTQLQAIKLDYTKRYIQITSRPNEDTIRVTKKLANGQTIEVPKSSNGSDGWVYLGLQTVPMVTEPVPMDYREGYTIQLLGEAYKLVGGESATVQYLPYGVQPSQ